MSKPSQGRGGETSDDEEETPEDVAEINRIMGRDKPAKLTSTPGMSLAERQQARMKAAAEQRKPGHTSSKTASSLTTFVPHNPQNPSHLPQQSPTSHHSHSPSLPSAPSSTTQTVSNTISTTTSTKVTAKTNPTMALKNIETISSDPHISSPMMRQMAAQNRNLPPSSSKESLPESQTKSLAKTSTKVPENSKPRGVSPVPLGDHKRALTASSLKTTAPPDDDVEFEPTDEDDDDEGKKKKKKKGFWGKVKKMAVGKKKKDTGKDKGDDSGSDEDDEKESAEMQADIDRIMRGKVERPTSPTASSGQGKGLSLQERAALAQKRAAGK